MVVRPDDPNLRASDVSPDIRSGEDTRAAEAGGVGRRAIGGACPGALLVCRSVGRRIPEVQGLCAGAAEVGRQGRSRRADILCCSAAGSRCSVRAICALRNTSCRWGASCRASVSPSRTGGLGRARPLRRANRSPWSRRRSPQGASAAAARRHGRRWDEGTLSSSRGDDEQRQR